MRLICAIALACLIVIVPTGYAYQSSFKSPPDAGSVVKVILPTGHGSAVHLGDGYLLTAAHVVEGAKNIKVKADDNRIFADVEVLWANTSYDVALLRIKGFSGGLESADYSCRDPKRGEMVVAKGSPTIIEHIETRGYIGSDAMQVGPWLRAYQMDAALGAGMSGGGVFDAQGYLIGINVGVLNVPAGFGGMSPSSLTFMVPASILCDLTLRTA